MPIPQRKSPRAKWLEYNEGLYFVTVCTKNREHFFGNIINGEMTLSPIGEFLFNELANENTHHPNVKVLTFVVMPNHFHIIVELNSDTARRVPTIEDRILQKIGKVPLPLLSSYIGSVKSAVSRFAHTINPNFAWQSRYHDHAIRGVADLNNISLYIENNVKNWDKDCFY